MTQKNRFDISKLKGKLGQVRDWMESHHLPPGVVLLLMGIASTIWFLVRVIPKPSRASYPCMQVAAPPMSGLVVYLISLTGITLAFRKAKHNFIKARYLPALFFVIAAMAATGVAVFNGSTDAFSFSPQAKKMGPDDGPNQPIGKSHGIYPGRVVWIWNQAATNENCTNDIATSDYYFTPANTNKDVVSEMISSSVKKLSGKATVKESWDNFFKIHNMKKYNKESGYVKGQKIFIKINQGTSRWMLTPEEKLAGYYFTASAGPQSARRTQSFPVTETNPYVLLEILRELVDESGIDQKDISVGDPMTNIYGHNFEVWHKAYPDVLYLDKLSDAHGRSLTHETEKELIFYSDKSQNDKLFDVIEKADYLINLSNLKPHNIAGISLTAKNHFGSHSRTTASHLHYALMGIRGTSAMNGGYKKYRVLVDLMGSKYLGQNTVFYLVDGLFGGGAGETKPPVKYFMQPFNNDWSNSIFTALDPVALESVCYDFLRTEWDGINKHSPANNTSEINPSFNGVDDHLHQAADHANWPEGIVYDPDNSGRPLPSLGIHEHWNNAQLKQYSRNLGKDSGIELVAIPESLVGNGMTGMTEQVKNN